MKELNEIINLYESKQSDLRCALVCIVQVNGSSYRKPGARILLFENGEFTGSISGGCLDGDALKKAQKVIYSKKPQMVRYDTTSENESAIGLGLGCQGIIDVLIQPLNDDGYEINQLRKIVKTREPLVMIQGIDDEALSNSKIYTKALTKNIDNAQIKGAIEDAFKMRKSSLIEIEEKKYSIQFYTPAIHLLICGHQFDSLVLSEIAERIGWQTTIYGKLQKIFYKGPVTENCIDNKSPLPAPDAYSACIIMSHDIDTDVKNLSSALSSEYPYIGLLGPINRRDKIYEALNGNYDPEILKNKVHTPVGLDIGARTPEEIAIAIIAEVSMYFSRTTGQSLRKVKG